LSGKSIERADGSVLWRLPVEGTMAGTKVSNSIFFFFILKNEKKIYKFKSMVPDALKHCPFSPDWGWQNLQK